MRWCIRQNLVTHTNIISSVWYKSVVLYQEYTPFPVWGLHGPKTMHCKRVAVCRDEVSVSPKSFNVTQLHVLILMQSQAFVLYENSSQREWDFYKSKIGYFFRLTRIMSVAIPRFFTVRKMGALLCVGFKRTRGSVRRFQGVHVIGCLGFRADLRVLRNSMVLIILPWPRHGNR